MTGVPRIHSSRGRAAGHFFAGIAAMVVPAAIGRLAGLALAAAVGGFWPALALADGAALDTLGGASRAATAARMPQRIISLTPSVTETLFALGAGPRVVAVSRYCDHPPEVSTLPRMGTFLAPAIESVIYLKPDLVITSPTPGNRNSVEAIERAGIRVVVVSEGSGSIRDVRNMIRETARVAGLPFEGAALISSIDSALEAVQALASGRPSPPVAVVVGHDPLVLAGPQSYLGELVTLGGGDNVARALGGKWPRTSWEFLLSAEPQVIIDASMDRGAATQAEALARRWSRYGVLPAVASGRVHGHASHLLLRPGPRIGEAARVVGRWIHPFAWNGRP